MGSRFEPTHVFEPHRSMIQIVPSVGSTSTPAVEPHFRPSGIGSTCPTQGLGRSLVGSHQRTIGAFLFCARNPTDDAATTAAATTSHFVFARTIESSAPSLNRRALRGELDERAYSERGVEGCADGQCLLVHQKAWVVHRVTCPDRFVSYTQRDEARWYPLRVEREVLRTHDRRD